MIRFNLIFTCLNCEKEIPPKEAIKGKMLCSEKCLTQMNNEGGNFDMQDVYMEKNFRKDYERR